MGCDSGLSSWIVCMSREIDSEVLLYKNIRCQV